MKMVNKEILLTYLKQMMIFQVQLNFDLINLNKKEKILNLNTKKGNIINKVVDLNLKHPRNQLDHYQDLIVLKSLLQLFHSYLKTYHQLYHDICLKIHYYFNHFLLFLLLPSLPSLLPKQEYHLTFLLLFLMEELLSKHFQKSIINL